MFVCCKVEQRDGLGPLHINWEILLLDARSVIVACVLEGLVEGEMVLNEQSKCIEHLLLIHTRGEDENREITLHRIVKVETPQAHLTTHLLFVIFLKDHVIEAFIHS